MSAAVREILEDEGIAVRTGANCIGFRPHAEGVAVSVDCEDGAPVVVGSHTLPGGGAPPEYRRSRLDLAGIETDTRGYIRSTTRCRPTCPASGRLGDCNGRGAFTHTAYNDFEIVAANLRRRRGTGG